MHAVYMNELIKPLLGFNKNLRLLDVGCGKGYSTLAYAMLAS
jgi:cyclopropane fatty-acyl-phospholipid synthase-like methyltransferase